MAIESVTKNKTILHFQGCKIGPYLHIVFALFVEQRVSRNQNVQQKRPNFVCRFDVREFKAFERQARRRLLYLNQAISLDDLRIPPSNHLEALVGDRKGLFSIRINAQWRICFRWKGGAAFDVEIVDYHQEAEMNNDMLAPILPGEILMEDFMAPSGISCHKLARDIDVPANRVSEIVAGRRAITADTGLRLAKYFGTSAEVWIGLQKDYELRVARQTSWPQVEANIHPLKVA